MGKKRYYYDYKGRSRGYSSNQSPQARNLKVLVFGLPILVILGMCSGKFEDTEQAQVRESLQQQTGVGSDNAVDPAILAALDETHVAKILEDEKEATAPSAMIPQHNIASNDYLHENYVNSNLNCPKDIQEYHVQECERGDQGSCTLVQACDPQSPVGIDFDIDE